MQWWVDAYTAVGGAVGGGAIVVGLVKIGEGLVSRWKKRTELDAEVWGSMNKRVTALEKTSKAQQAEISKRDATIRTQALSLTKLEGDHEKCQMQITLLRREHLRSGRLLLRAVYWLDEHARALAKELNRSL